MSALGWPRDLLRLLEALLLIAVLAGRPGRLRRRDRRKYQKMARDLGLNRHKILSRDFGWNTSTVALTIAFLLPGTRADSLADLALAMKNAGYSGVSAERLAARERSIADLPRSIWQQGTPKQAVPKIDIAFFDVGEVMSWEGVTVPPLHTGVQLSLTGRSSP